MAVDLLFSHIRISAGRHILENTPRNLPSWREASIQVDKLARTLDKVVAAMSRELDRDLPGKKVRKQTGKEARRLDRQHQTVDRFLKQLMFESNVGKVNGPTKKLRAATEVWLKALNRNAHTASRMLLPEPPVVADSPAVSGFRKSLRGFKGMRPRRRK
jgi:hypothetical protein